MIQDKFLELSDKATPGPWKWLPNAGQFVVAPGLKIVAEVPCQGCNPEDGAFIVACVNHVREQLAAAEGAKEPRPWARLAAEIIVKQINDDLRFTIDRTSDIYRDDFEKIIKDCWHAAAPDEQGALRAVTFSIEKHPQDLALSEQCCDSCGIAFFFLEAKDGDCSTQEVTFCPGCGSPRALATPPAGKGPQTEDELRAEWIDSGALQDFYEWAFKRMWAAGKGDATKG
jgi:hypothetical protein